MIKALGVKQNLRRAILPGLSAALIGYFAYHAVQGNHGLLARAHLHQEIATAEVTLDTLTQQRTVLEQRVRLLSDDSLDLDMLEERVRVMLNFGHPTDVILHLD